MPAIVNIQFYFAVPSIEAEVNETSKINLRDYYPFYHNDYVIEIPGLVAEELRDSYRLEAV